MRVHCLHREHSCTFLNLQPVLRKIFKILSNRQLDTLEVQRLEINFNLFGVSVWIFHAWSVTISTSQTHGDAENKFFIKLKQRKSQSWTRFGYTVIISIYFDDFFLHLLPSFCFDWEDIYPMLERMFHRLSKYLEFRRKYSVALRVVSTSTASQCLDIPM